jgi:signal transduction histidine kinase
MGGGAGLTVLTLVTYFIDGRREIALAAVLMGTLSASGLLWAGRLTPSGFEASLLLDLAVVTVWAWLLGGLALGVAPIFSWTILASALVLGSRSTLRFALLSVLLVCGLGVAHLLFHTVAFEADRAILLNLMFSVALLAALGALLHTFGRVRHDAESAVAVARLRLAELHEMREEFLSSVSFEMRTPLTSVKGFTSTLLESWDVLPEAERFRFLQIVNQQSDQLTRLIQTMVDFAQLDSGTIHLVREPVNLSDVLGKVRARALRSLGDLDVEVECEPGLWVRGDTERLRGLLGDLIENGATHGASPVRVVARREGSWVEIEVTDAGPGVPEDKVELLFERRSGSVAQARGARGLGMGLALAREMAVAMGGGVRYQPNQTGGSFVVWLPAVEGPPSRVEEASVPLRLLVEFPAESEPTGR